MTVGRDARTSLEVITQTASSGQNARTSVEVLTQTTAKGQMARVSMEVLVPVEITDQPRWGIPWK